MSKVKLEWFNLDSYAASENFSAKEWLVEIRNRIYLESFLGHDKDAGSFYEMGLQMIDHIKKNGLFCHLNANFISNLEPKFNDENQFVTNLDTDEAFSFLYYSDRKDEFEVDSKKFTTQRIGSEEAKENLKRYDAKYNHAIAIEVIEQANRTDKLNNYDSKGSNDEGYRFLKVDLHASDEILFLEFKKWLQIERKSHGLKLEEKNFNSSDFLDWHKSMLLAYWDIENVSKLDGISITNDAIGKLLFPNEYDVTLSERIRKVVSLKAKRVISYSTFQTLESQVRVE